MNKNCCINCFSEPEIINFIELEEVIGNCHYCNSKNVNVCNVDDVGRFVLEGFKRHYEDAANQVGFCSSEGGYLLSTQEDIADILIREQSIFGDELGNPYPLLEELVTLDGTPYVRKDPYGPPSGDPEEIRHWENFCNTVKTKQRFSIFLASHRNYGNNQPGDFLSQLANNFIPTLINIIEPRTKLFRARINNEDKKWSHKDLTSPPPKVSKSNRMSPSGFSFFYGGLGPEVCIHEVGPRVGESVVVAEFESIKPLIILDLSVEVESRRSIFDDEYLFDYEEYFKPFLVHFINDISRPIKKSDSEIEYVPTQVFTEFIKTVNFKDQYYRPDSSGNHSDVFIDGILFKSSIMKNGINLVLFKGPEISLVNKTGRDDAWLRYKRHNIYKVTEIEIKSTLKKKRPTKRST